MAGLAPDTMRLDQDNGEPSAAEPETVILEAPPGPSITEVDPVRQEMTITHSDGSVTVSFGVSPEAQGESPMEHTANLAEHLSDQDLAAICDDLMLGIAADIASRSDWLEMRAESIKLLGLVLKKPGTGENAELGIATVDHPMLLEAALRFQANARGELLPSTGPVKVRDDLPIIKGRRKVAPQPPGPPIPKIEEMPPLNADLSPTAALPAPMQPQPGPPTPPQMPPPGLGADPMAAPGAPNIGVAGMLPPPMGHNGGPPMEPPNWSRSDMTEALEGDMNHYLTVTAKEYVPDTDRMLLMTGVGGCGFKKVYKCPIRRRPVSESVDAADLIVSNAATDLNNCGRVTHQIMMRPATLKRMEIVGAYRKIPALETTTPTPTPDIVEKQKAETVGINITPQRPEDADHTIYECYCELNIKGFEHKDAEGNETGLPVPYVVVIDRDNRAILAIRRNYAADDDMCIAKIPFVKYPFVPGFGFYDFGLGHILGNTTRAVTAAWREMLDAGMFASFPGFLFLKSALRQTTNTFRVAPGGGAPVDSSVDDINKAVMPLPYKDPSTALMELIKSIAETGARVGGTAEIAVGEGKQDAPVGTTIALMEQATKIVDAVHKRLHAAQAEEFQLLKELFRQDPSPLWAHRKSKLNTLTSVASAADEAEREQAKQAVIAALEDADIVPQADPNTPSHMHRVMKAVAVLQLAMTQPDLYDLKEVHERVLQMIKVEDYESMFKPPAPQTPPQPSPDMVFGVHGELAKTAMSIASRERIEAEKLADKERDRQHEQAMADDENALALASTVVSSADRVASEKAKTITANRGIDAKTEAAAAAQKAKEAAMAAKPPGMAPRVI